MAETRPSKRRRVEPTNCDSSTESEVQNDSDTESEVDLEVNEATSHSRRSSPLRSLNRDISPPGEYQGESVHLPTEYIPSPISLTRIRDLPEECNIDTVTIDDILGDPLIKEAWIFNFLFDIPFIISCLDSDVRDTVLVKIVHGFWKNEDKGTIGVLEAGAAKHPNVELLRAYMAEQEGTHHTKCIILIRHDDMAQVVIHTANMIRRDWANLTQAVWRSPLLPLTDDQCAQPENAPVGSGHRFKRDLLSYLRTYGSRTKHLTEQLKEYGFSKVRAALVGSCPGRQTISATNAANQTVFGWRGLREILKHIPSAPVKEDEGPPQIVIQMSSVGMLGKEENWFTPFLNALGTTGPIAASTNAVTQDHDSQGPTSPSKRTYRFFTSNGNNETRPTQPRFHIIFPTAEEIRQSLDGYVSGGSIHWKLQNTQQQNQLKYLRPLLRHWDPTTPSPKTATTRNGNVVPREALRRRAAPHIKTYIRFSSAKMDRIDWAMVTSANLSKHAWGEMEKDGENGRYARICSYELGVVVWPALFEEEEAGNAPKPAVMVPTFGTNMPDGGHVDQSEAEAGSSKVIVGFRMPYDLPLVPYSPSEIPWCAVASHDEPDWKGATWAGYTR
ncbi:phospholipase D/nuclease [Rhizodiscina lignyota]|uniref:Phospholipase D/nuclease n=1 Tax=Rhizodiscina lignyota TaxID=1504668 RepID=A0A9P4IGI2_9PEZI|nr:phospholipase D/nuclease [Rhizodiscina lignyota]